jgi:hypothetical protein
MGDGWSPGYLAYGSRRPVSLGIDRLGDQPISLRERQPSRAARARVVDLQEAQSTCSIDALSLVGVEGLEPSTR